MLAQLHRLSSKYDAAQEDAATSPHPLEVEQDEEEPPPLPSHLVSTTKQ